MTGRRRGERERRGGRENPPSMLSERAIYFHNARSDSFPISSSTRCIVADWALSNSHLLMTLERAWQHIIDMPIQMDVSALLSAAYGADIQLMVTNVKKVCVMKRICLCKLFIRTAVALLEFREDFVIIFFMIFAIHAASSKLKDTHKLLAQYYSAFTPPTHTHTLPMVNTISFI